MPLVLFDLDHTLYDRETTFRRWAASFLAGQDDVAAEDVTAEVDWLCAVDGDGMTDRCEVFTEVRRRYGLETSVSDLEAGYRRDFLDTIVPDPRVLQALGLLRDEGWRIGVVTNGPVPHQANKAERLGLLPLVDGFCASDEIGVGKPEAQLFHEAIRRCGGPAPEMWMVGDSPLSDIGGARALGLRTVWIHRGRAWNPVVHGSAPDHEAEDVPDAILNVLLPARRDGSD